MMTKEEVAQVIAYCDENKISHKRKYAPKNDGENAGEFLQLVPEGSFLPNPIKPSRLRGTIQMDGYGAYDQFESDPHIRVIGCWAHARRKWSDALDEDKRTASEALALGRKNFLFCGNHDAAIRAAIVYSLVDSCKALDVDLREWMEDVLLRIPGNENNREALRELLPDRWAKQTN